MNGPLKWGWQFLVATQDELDIEAELFETKLIETKLIETKLIGRGLSEAHLVEFRMALREIDRLKIAGTYDVERERLMQFVVVDPQPDWFKALIGESQTPEFIINRNRLKNLLRGLNSPDEKQCARFRTFYKAADMETKVPSESFEIIAPLEKAKMKNGRPGVSPPWRNEVEAMDAMRKSCAGGLSTPCAAREAARLEGRATEASRAGYFEKLYRKKARLRE